MPAVALLRTDPCDPPPRLRLCVPRLHLPAYEPPSGGRLRAPGRAVTWRLECCVATEWAYRKVFSSTTTAPTPLHTGSSTTTLNAPTAHSEANPRSADYYQPDGRVHLVRRSRVDLLTAEPARERTAGLLALCFQPGIRLWHRHRRACAAMAARRPRPWVRFVAPPARPWSGQGHGLGVPGLVSSRVCAWIP